MVTRVVQVVQQVRGVASVAGMTWTAVITGTNTFLVVAKQEKNKKIRTIQYIWDLVGSVA